MSRLLRTWHHLRHAATAASPRPAQCPLLPRTTLSTPATSSSPFSTTPSPPKKHTQLPPRPSPPPDSEIDESFLKGSGPGGQKINKTNSAVQLKHLPTGIVVKCQATRSRTENRKIARQLLADRLDDLRRGDQSRAAVVGDFRRKKRASAAKKKRRKYRKLNEDGQEVEVEVDEEDETAIEAEEKQDQLEGKLEAVEDTKPATEAQDIQKESNQSEKGKT
ncbi:RF-1 domain-containing protein [Pestalotiopsis sp. NC0098]|nr:RF-1 domain-containing protein [Pestalotiopsis sp. NC0098]